MKPNLILLGLVNIISLLTIVLIALVSASTQPIYYNPSYPSNSLTEKLIMAESNSTLIASWCLSNSYNSSMVDTCTTYTNLSGSRMNIYLGISIIILLARLLTKIVILHMAKYLRFKDKVELSLGVMFHLFVNYTMISVLVTLSVKYNLYRFNPICSALPWGLWYPPSYLNNLYSKISTNCSITPTIHRNGI